MLLVPISNSSSGVESVCPDSWCKEHILFVFLDSDLTHGMFLNDDPWSDLRFRKLYILAGEMIRLTPIPCHCTETREPWKWQSMWRHEILSMLCSYSHRTLIPGWGDSGWWSREREFNMAVAVFGTWRKRAPIGKSEDWRGLKVGVSLSLK